MIKVIIGQPGCPKCKMLASMCQDVKYIEPQASEVIAIAKTAGVSSLPIVVAAGDVEELAKVIGGE